MTPQQITKQLQDKFGGDIVEAYADDKHPRIHVYADKWRAIAEYVKSDANLSLDWLGCLTAVDYVADNELAVVYDLRSSKHNHWFAVKVLVSRDEPKVPSVVDLWTAADWHEREAFDMMGIIFEGHPDLRRILLPEDWEGHPLRKDYEFPRDYHGIPGTYEMDWQQNPDYPA